MLTALLFEFPSFGQNQSIYLKFERDDMTIPSKQDATIFAHGLLSINMVEDVSGFKIPVNIPNYVIYSRYTNRVQLGYESWVKKGMNRQAIAKIMSREYPGYAYDTMNIQDVYIYIYVGSDQTNKYVIIDTNNNKDFTDDKLYTYPLKGYQTDVKRCEIIDIAIPYYTGDGYTTINGKVGVFPYRYINDSNMNCDTTLKIMFTSYRSSMLGKLTLDNKNILMRVSSNEHIITTGVRKNDNIMIIPDTTQNTHTYKKVGDTVQLGERKLLLKDIDENQLEMLDLGKLADSSTVGCYLPDIYAYDTEDSSKVYLNEMMKGKYVLIDFWGSWCSPCIASLDNLVKMYSKIKDLNDVMVIGIASERDANGLTSMKEIILSKNVKWKNYWFNKKDDMSIYSPAGKLKIVSYPSYIITDKNGKIVFTTNNKNCKREEVIDFFLNLIK